LLLAKGLASTRTKAQELINDGKVAVDGEIVTKSGAKFSETALISTTESEHPYVSRGGLKLKAALEAFKIAVKGKRALDVGQSTGGFTHCLLLEGAGEVVGVDVGSEQLAPELRASPQVTVFEKQDIRQLNSSSVGSSFDLFVVDVSFISSTLILPVLPAFLRSSAEGVVLIKPQFELSAGELGSGGIVRSSDSRQQAIDRVLRAAEAQNFTVAGNIPAPITGGDGNQEYLLHLRWHSSG
jgi:23S rRNA (cytidine1920-2'-O)/16S rRNA (cytidine1409-2'-O)-methyltransferase